jgi:hydroxymethylglutaryl-CoA reductase (NADPH)
VPLATTEGALVASYRRGAHVLSLAGGASAICLVESLSRAPCFAFTNLTEMGIFCDWVTTQAEAFERQVTATTSHGHLRDIRLSCTGTLVYLIFEYTTGDAAGQNMVTIATDAVCRYILAEAPVTPVHWFVEANLSGDKKASMVSFLGTRGKKVIASAAIPADLIRRFLHTTAEAMATYWLTSALGGVQSGTIGVQGQFANALTAIFLACGQDVACVSEASIGITQMQADADGTLHTSVTLPNLTVGTVGGGTHLPTAAACLEMLGCRGPGRARAFAEICAATVLAGEISIIAAISAGDFAQAHATHRHGT